jgi:outer membrane protein assembly factor BamB
MKQLNIALFASALLALTACGTTKQAEPAPLTHYGTAVNIDRVWRVSAGKGALDSHLKLQPSVNGDVIYTADTSGDVSAINIESGKRLWRYHYPASFSSNLASTDEAIYIGSNEGILFKIDATYGYAIWSRAMPSSIIAKPLVNNNTIYVKTINGEITALEDADNTKILWTYQQPNPPLILRDTSNLSLTGDNLIAGFPNGHLVKLASNNGTPIWEKEVKQPEGKTDVERMVDIDATPILEGQNIYTATYQGEILALSEVSGDVRWSHDSSIYNNLGTDETALYATDEKSFLWAYDKNTGEALWRQESFKNRNLTAPAILGSFLIVGDSEGYIHVVDTESGRLLGRTKISTTGISATPIVVNDNVLVLTNGGVLYAFHISDKK